MTKLTLMLAVVTLVPAFASPGMAQLQVTDAPLQCYAGLVEAKPILINATRLFDGERLTHEGGVEVLVRNGRINRIGRPGSLPREGAEVIDAGDATIMPGLIDVHAHLGYSGQTLPGADRDRHADLRLPVAGRSLLSVGITTIREPAPPMPMALAYRSRVCRGELSGPRMSLAGKAFYGSRPADFDRPLGWGVGDAADVRRKVDAIADQGSQWVKIIDAHKMPEVVLSALVQRARERKLRVAMHGLSPDEYRVALKAGADTIEHVFSEGGDIPDDIMASLRSRGSTLTVVPTLGATRMFFIFQQYPDRLDERDIGRFWPSGLWRQLLAQAKAQKVEGWLVEARAALPTYEKKLAQLRQAGVGIGVGSESGGTNHFHRRAMADEMATLVSYGMSEVDVLSAATKDAAELLGIEPLGRAVPGAPADLLVVGGNPLEDIAAIGNVLTVVQQGVVKVSEGNWRAEH